LDLTVLRSKADALAAEALLHGTDTLRIWSADVSIMDALALLDLIDQQRQRIVRLEAAVMSVDERAQAIHDQQRQHLAIGALQVAELQARIEELEAELIHAQKMHDHALEGE
jgi:hypothetical protein